MTESAKEHARAWIDQHRAELSEWHRTIWNFAEPAWHERRSAAWYVDLLRREGFEVEEGSGGMPTAFSATWSTGNGPTLLTYAEYDAVPGNSQQAVAAPGPRPGTTELAAGHTDPHSALGITTLAALLATKDAMLRHGIGGTLRYTGEPAEKVQGSKVVHGLRGYYDDVDAVISFHPFYLLPLCNTVRWDTHCGAYYSRIYTFHCEHPEDWGLADPASPIPASHSAARAPGANAALVTMYNLSKTNQDAMAPAFGGWSLSEAILSAGDSTADNIPARFARIQYSWRCPDLHTAEQVSRVLDANAEAAASATHCTVESRWVARNRPGLANHALAEATYRNLAEVGPPVYDQRAVDVAREFQSALGMEPAERPLLPETETLIDPEEAERRLRELLPPTQANWTSDDYVEMTWYAPTSRLYIARPALAPRPDGRAYPSWVMNALGGIPDTIDPTIHCGAKTIAGTLLDLLTIPELLTTAKAEFDRRRVGGPARPLLPADFTAPHDYGWPA